MVLEMNAELKEIYFFILFDFHIFKFKVLFEHHSVFMFLSYLITSLRIYSI